MLAINIDQKTITTIEGIGDVYNLHPVQKAFLENDSGQCGYCSPGFLLSTLGLLRRLQRPNESQIKEALEGNLCRCNAYGRILEGIKKAVKGLDSSSDI
jgi:carbon-monoxide dehydrogenase small subunit